MCCAGESGRRLCFYQCWSNNVHLKCLFANHHSFCSFNSQLHECSCHVVCSFLLPADSSRLHAVATSSDGGLEGFKAYPVFKEIESLLREVKQQREPSPRALN